MLEWGFKRLECEHCVYYRETDTGIVVTAIHVNDFLLIASTNAASDEFIGQLGVRYKISNLGEPKFCIGIKIERDHESRSVYLSQNALIDRIISDFRQVDCTPKPTPMDSGLKLSCFMWNDTPEENWLIAAIPYRALVGTLIYVAIGTRLDIQFAVNHLSQFVDCYTSAHWDAAIRVVRYLKGTRDLRLCLGGSKADQLVGFTDASFACCPDTRRSVSGYCFSLGSGMISWATRKQKTVSTSSCEAEYVAGAEAVKEVIWLRALLLSLDFKQIHPSPLMCDNQSTLVLSGNPSFHARVKHIDIKHHFIRECVESNDVLLHYVNTKDNIADALPKALDPKAFQRFRFFMGLR